MFGTKGHHQEANGFKNWRNDMEKFCAPLLLCTKTQFLPGKLVSKYNTTVVSLINSQQKVFDENRQYLMNVIETIVFIGSRAVKLASES